MSQQEQPTQPQMSESERIRDRKKHVVATLNDKFSTEIWRERLMKICGNDESRIMKALNSFITYIMNDDGGKDDRKAYIADCSMSSISTAFLEAFQMGIEVGGGRDHAYLVNYAGQCELDISYKGFVYALNKHFDDAFVIAECVFEGDKFTASVTDATASYTHIPNPEQPFGQNWDKLKGAYCYFSYTTRDTKQKVSRLVRIQRGDDKTPDSLSMIRSKAKGSWAWKDFPFEQCKKATLRRGAKVPFASIDFGDDDTNPELVDNRHYALEGNDSGGNRLLKLMQAQQELMDDDKPKDKTGETGNGDAGNMDAGNPDIQGNGAPEGTANPAPAAEASAPDKAAEAATSTDAGEIQPPAAQGKEDMGTAGASGEPPATKEISEADFEEVDDKRPSPPVSAYSDHIAEPSKMVEPDHIRDATKMVVPPWDGRTLMINGKAQAKDFPTPAAACIYLKKVLSQRKHKASRVAIIGENASLMAALIKEGQGAMIADLHKLASEGL